MKKNSLEFVPRYCSIAESLRESCKQVKLMSEGKMLEKSWAQFRDELKTFKEDNL